MPVSAAVSSSGLFTYEQHRTGSEHHGSMVGSGLGAQGSGLIEEDGENGMEIEDEGENVNEVHPKPKPRRGDRGRMKGSQVGRRGDWG